MRARKVGRPPKFQLGAIAYHEPTGDTFVLVDRRTRGTKPEYRGIRINGRKKRYGPAKWMSSAKLTSIGERSGTASVLTYRANEYLDAEVGRGCPCQCCVHTRIPHSEFKVRTGEWKEGEDD